MLFLFSLFTALLAGAAAPVYTHWTGGLPVWPVAIPAALIGATSAFLLGKYTPRFCGNKVCAGLAILCAVIAFAAFGDTAHDVDTWKLLSLRIGLDHTTWHRFVMGQALLWFGWAAFILPFLMLRFTAPRSKLILFVGMCCGLILARIFSGLIPTIRLYDVALAGCLHAAPLLLLSQCQKPLTRGAVISLMALLLLGWYFGMRRASNDLLTEVHPFAPIAARDGVYTGETAAGFTLKKGRVVRTAGVDIAAQTASQLIPALFFPAPTARIAYRLQTGEPILQGAETGKLSGNYHAIWVELPPAWDSAERDYYGRAALASAKDHLMPDGILVYENDGHALDARMLMERIESLRRVFPQVQLWMTSRNHWQLVASQTPLTLSATAINTLLDREDVAKAFLSANLESPFTLLSCCFIAETARLKDFLTETVKPAISRGSAGKARQLLFDGVGGKRLEEAFQPYYDLEMPWVSVPDMIAPELRLVLSTLRNARILALQGKHAEASQANPTDPYLQSLADRECCAARAFERMAEHEKALQLYRSAFAIAKPRVTDVIDAAEIARKSDDTSRAAPYFNLAVELASTSPDILMRRAQWYLEHGQATEAEADAREALKNIDSPEEFPTETANVMFFIAQATLRQAGRAAEGLDLAKAIILSTPSKELRQSFVPAYGQMLIDAGLPVLGVRVKRHWEAYGELLPELDNTPQESPTK
jgi:tetratricopeptide (TPR) repeat protein